MAGFLFHRCPLDLCPRVSRFAPGLRLFSSTQPVPCFGHLKSQDRKLSFVLSLMSETQTFVGSNEVFSSEGVC
jgi:hypothetical protein